MNILNKLTNKHLIMNKKRTIVTIIGVILSCALMVGIGLLFSSIRDYMIQETKRNSGSHHVAIFDINNNQYQTLNKHTEVKHTNFMISLGASKIESQNFYKPYYMIKSGNKDLLETLHLETGRLPENDREIVISSHVLSNGGISLKVGDILNLEVGIRTDLEQDPLEDTSVYDDTMEMILNPVKKQYTIVGIVERSLYESYSSAGYYLFTYQDSILETQKATAYVTYKKTDNIYSRTNQIMKNLGFETTGDLYSNLEYNDALLALHGQSRYNNIISGFAGLIAIILSLISVGCIIVIYNSFAISVMERKKQFGLFSSIGATKKQLRKTVFYEAFIIGIIGIPLGVLSAFLGIGIVIQVINYLIPDFFDVSLKLTAYSWFLIIPIVFMIITIFLSAYFPARRASKITPIEAIRQNDDIKIKGKKVKTGKWVARIFGMEGDIALKNIKRNKKKYRITVASLFISIVLFISFSSFLEYGVKGAGTFMDVQDYDLYIDGESKNNKKINDLYALLAQHKDVKEYTIYQYYPVLTKLKREDLTKEAIEFFYLNEFQEDVRQLYLVVLEEKQMNDYKKSIHYTKEDPILINRLKGVKIQNGKYQGFDVPLLKDKQYSFPVCKSKVEEEDVKYVCKDLLNSIHLSNVVPFGLSRLISEGLLILVSQEQFNQIMDYIQEGEDHYYIESKSFLASLHDYKTIDEEIEKLEKDKTYGSFNYYNNLKEKQLEKNFVLVVQILLYGFISLVTLIGVTSVFNTIHASIALRRKEFAMLRSMGLTPQGFNKMLYFESFFVGFKSLLYALPVAIVVTMLIHIQMNNLVSFSSLIIPWKFIMIAIVAVFLIILLTMFYASHKIKRENILDAIREENI